MADASASHPCLALLEHLARASRRAAEQRLEEIDLRPRHFVALSLLDDTGPIGQQGFGDTLNLDPSNVVGLLNELEDRGLVVRRRQPTDRRRHVVELSPAGRRKLDAAQTLVRGAEDEVLSALSAEERDALHELLSRAAGGQLGPSPCVADGPCVADEAEHDCSA